MKTKLTPNNPKAHAAGRTEGSQQRGVMPHRVKTKLTREVKMCERISASAKSNRRWRLKEYTDGYIEGIKYAVTKIYAA